MRLPPSQLFHNKAVSAVRKQREGERREMKEGVRERERKPRRKEAKKEEKKLRYGREGGEIKIMNINHLGLHLSLY